MYSRYQEECGGAWTTLVCLGFFPSTQGSTTEPGKFDSRTNEVGFLTKSRVEIWGVLGGVFNGKRTAPSSYTSLFGRLVDAFAGSHRVIFSGGNGCRCLEELGRPATSKNDK